MSVRTYPGEFRLGVLNEAVIGVRSPGPMDAPMKIQLLVILSGHQEFRINGHPFVFTARPKPMALLTRFGTPAVVEFTANRGAPLQKLALAMPLDWFERFMTDAEAPKVNLSGDLSWVQWCPSQPIIDLGRAILGNPDPLLRLSIGFNLLRNALEEAAGRPVVLAPPPQAASAHAQSTEDRIEAVRGFIAAQSGRMTAAEIARECGIGLRTLQRLFKQVVGQTLGEYMRENRLQSGLDTLSFNRASIAEAAWIAGYSSAANFSTAVKRIRGASPRSLTPPAGKEADKKTRK